MNNIINVIIIVLTDDTTETLQPRVELDESSIILDVPVTSCSSVPEPSLSCSCDDVSDVSSLSTCVTVQQPVSNTFILGTSASSTSIVQLDDEQPASSEPLSSPSPTHSSTTSSSTNSQTHPLCTDVALLRNSTLSDDHKYFILTNKSPQLKEYPINHQKRRFQAKWVQTYPWIRYSQSQDGVYCAPCFIFGRSGNLLNDELVQSPFSDWKNATGTTRGALHHHSQCQLHQSSNEKAINFLAVMEKHRQSVTSQLSKSYDVQVQRNTKALLSIL